MYPIVASLQTAATICVRTFLYVLQFKVVENLIMIVVAYVT